MLEIFNNDLRKQLALCAKVEQNDRYNPPVPNVLLININGQNKILLDKEL